MTKPLYNQFSNNLADYIESSLRAFAHKFQTCIPAIVKEVKSRDTVVVSPAVLQTSSNGTPLEWADITTTMLTPFGGNMFLSMPVAVGDTGWLVGADLDTYKFKQNKKPAQQTIFTRHQYQFGFFVPDIINGYTVEDTDDGAIVLSSIDGSTKISIKKNEISLVSGGDLKINAQNVKIESSGNNVLIDGVNFKAHAHTVPSGIALQAGSYTGATTATAITSGVNNV